MRFFNIAERNVEMPAVNYIGQSFCQSITPWLNLLKIYQRNGNKTEFEVVAHRLQDDFNLRLILWRPTESAGAELSLKNFPHIARKIVGTSGRKERLMYVQGLLKDNRTGNRSGFPVGVFEELLLMACRLDRQCCHATGSDSLMRSRDLRSAVPIPESGSLADLRPSGLAMRTGPKLA